MSFLDDFQKVNNYIHDDQDSPLFPNHLVFLAHPIKTYRGLKTAVQEYENMKKTNEELKSKGLSADKTDGYYHTKAHCRIAQDQNNSDVSRYISVLKEDMDYREKVKKGKMSLSDIIKDCVKDMRNNAVGERTGSFDKTGDCGHLLDYLRTEGMKNEKIW